jgi:protein-S-isoprenylcysteine O-methyltransferase Ste14
VLFVLRQALAIAVLPFTVTVLVPLWLARRFGIGLGVGTALPELLAALGGLVLIAAGLGLFAASRSRFITDGRGTLAPWDPPQALVIRGPYRYVRNPMISGVVLVLFGEALFLLSGPHLTWTLVFLAINAIYIPLLEEPLLALRFGDAYRDYCRHVPRLLPRLRPWDPELQAPGRTP